jgi:hypothetical protein
MSIVNSVSSYVEKTQARSECIGDIVLEMKKISVVELQLTVESLAEQIEGARFKLGYALSIIADTPLDLKRIIGDWPLPLKQYIEEQTMNIARLEQSELPLTDLAGIPWSRLNHMAEFLGVENFRQVVSLARKGTFAEFAKETELARRIARAVRHARRRVMWDWAKANARRNAVSTIA